MPEPAFRTVGLGAGYHGHAVVRNLDIEVGRGEVVALLGPNGAGKTTTILTLAGELPPVMGQVVFAGMRGNAPLHRRARAGVGLITEERSIFPLLTTAENLRVGRGDLKLALRIFPELEPLLRRRAGLLSGGEQQMLTLARTLSRRPKVVLADELSLGLAPLAVQRLHATLRASADDDGVGVLMVEQHVRQALKVADRAYVLQRGEIVLEGEASQVALQVNELEGSYLARAQ